MNTKVAVLNYTDNQLLLVEIPPDTLISDYLFSEEHLGLSESCTHWMMYDSIKEINL